VRTTFKTNASGCGDNLEVLGLRDFGQPGYREAVRVGIRDPDLLCEPSGT
jgi:hypothetical protein